MGDILKKITELLDEGADIEQSRSTGIIIRSKINWFDAIDGLGTTEPDKTKIDGVGNIEERELEKKSKVK